MATPTRSLARAVLTAPASQPVFSRKLMKPGPATSGGSQRSSIARRHVARRAAQPFAERHGEVGLVIAEFGILAGAHHREQIGRVVDQALQGRAEAVLQFGENIHAGLGFRNVQHAHASVGMAPGMGMTPNRRGSKRAAAG